MLLSRTLLAAFGNRNIKLALACRDHKKMNIFCCEKIEAPISAGEITDIALMKDILFNYLAKNKIKKCKVRIVLQHPQSSIRMLQFPNIKKAGQLLDKEFKNSLDGLFPTSNTPFIIDYRAEKGEDGGVRAVAVRIPEAAALAYSGLFKDIGLQPIAIDTYANAASVYLERKISGNYMAVFENPLSVNILLFTKGKLAASRDIRYEDSICAVSELRNYMLLQRGIKKIFLFTDLGIAHGALSELDVKIHDTSEVFMEFYGLFKECKE